MRWAYPHRRVQSTSNLIVLLEPRAASKNLWEPELASGPFMWPIFPWAGAGALTHCEGSRPTPQTM